MLDKIKSGLNFTIIIVFIIALIYFIVISIINAFLPPKGSEVTKISQENVNIYMVEDNVVHDYTIFFNVEKIIQNTIYNLNKKEYEKVYSTLSSDAQKNINKSYFMSNIEKYNNNNFKYDINDEQNISGYRNTNNLKMLYRINQNEFLAVVTSTNSHFYSISNNFFF
jgi:hypothetical protein